MKSVIAFTTALTLAVPCITSFTTSPKNMTYAVNEENSQLSQLASSLGADTDCLKITNYTLSKDYLQESPEYKKIYRDFCDKADNVTNIRCSNSSTSLFYNGVSFGIASLQTLAHNGLILPSDIQEGAEKMSDIVKDDKVDKLLQTYHIMQFHTDYKLYKVHQATAYSREETLKNLISDAENHMNDGKYFNISIFGLILDEKLDTTGIGCADGNWTFDNVTYNKCILTLDPNAAGFNEEYCIYINTETNQYCVPAYDWIDENCEICSFTDDKLLNSKGSIKPTAEYDTDLSKFNYFESGQTPNDPIMGYDGVYTKYIGINPDGTEYEVKYNSTTSADTLPGCFYGEGTKFRMENCSNVIRANQKMWTSAGFSTNIPDDENCAVGTNIELTDTSIIMTTEDNEKFNGREKTFVNQFWLNEGYHDFSPCCDYFFMGFTDSNRVESRITDEGIVLSSDGEKMRFKIDIDNAEQNSPICEFVTAYNDVLIKVNKFNKFIIMTDTDKDGVFETTVKKGDANCDGKIDAADASEILAGYAAASKGEQNYVNKTFGDFNEDGGINSSDASAVLEYYAKVSSGQIK